ncbi:MAG: hypothetical protein ABI295_08375, partial [Xanthomarina sp.]
MNKFIIITFILSSNFLLLGKQAPGDLAPVDNTKSDASKIIPDFINDKPKETSEAPIKSLPPINITPLHDYDVPDLKKLKEQPTTKNLHSPCVQEKKTLQHIHSEGKDILTVTYTSTSPEGYAFLKEKYPDLFEHAEKLHQKNFSAEKEMKPSLAKTGLSLEKNSQWILKSSMNNAPKLLQGIFY